MEKIATHLPGCFVLQPRIFEDHRGRLVKTYHHDTFRDLGLAVDYGESYYSVSKAGVLRGLHFQRPPYAQVKVVTCIAGRLLDAVVDVRRDSPTYGQSFAIELSAQQANMLYVPEGFAHGFYAMEDHTIIQYFGSAMFHPESDGGIRWDSCGIEWPVEAPAVSEKDRNLPTLAEFETPFQMSVSAEI
jgi:dTDP-4-dehydrorhamnose 3,5-epimerase